MIKKLALVSSLSILSIISFSKQSFADTTDKKDATATFELVPPEQTLSITYTTDLPFKNATIAANDVVTTNSSDVSITIEELSGEAPGWQLSAKLDNFIGTANNRTIIGAELFYPSITPKTNYSVGDSAISPVSISKDSAFEGASRGTIITAGASAENIVTAAVGKGYGSWTMTYPAGDMQLKIPAGNLKDSYTANLTYTLTDSP